MCMVSFNREIFLEILDEVCFLGGSSRKGYERYLEYI